MPTLNRIISLNEEVTIFNPPWTSINLIFINMFNSNEGYNILSGYKHNATYMFVILFIFLLI